MSSLRRLEAWLEPTQNRGDWRTPFFVRTWAYGMVFALCFGGLAVRQHLFWLAGSMTFLFAGGFVCLWLYRVTGRLRLLTSVSLAIVAPVLAFTGLLQNPPNPITPVFLVLIPLLAGFFLSRWELWVWLGIAVTLGAVSEWLMANGVHLDVPPRPHHGVVVALNLVALVLLVVSFVRWFDGMRTDMVSKLEAASRARTIFLANVSHEIRTPMNGVLGLTELVLAGDLQEPQRERLELAHRSAQSLVALIDDLLLVTRAESGRLVMSPGPCDVHKVVADVTELFRPVAAQKGLVLTASVSSALPRHVRLDAVRWRQVLTNLISNAVKFTEKGRVEVHLEGRDGRLVMEVRDQGPGIAPEVQARLFRPFEQADDSTTRRFGGSGLGLALSRQLVEAMGGTLTVRSTLGQGSAFAVELPLLVEETPLPLPRSSEVALIDRPVLVVDDNPVNLMVARGLVERVGYSVEVARNGREAVEAVLKQDFALVLMDCQMPEMDGLEATRMIRSSQRTQPPIVALTASGLPEELEACRRAGMDDCLVKPVSLEMVKRALTLAR